MIINHNLQSMNAYRQLNIVTSEKAKNVEKLSSGYKINRAADDASGLAISEKMRRQIRGLNRAAENIQDGISLCNVADGALNEIHDIFQRERKLLIQAANDTNSREDRSYMESEINNLTSELDRIFDDTDFNGIYLFKGHDKYLDEPDSGVEVKGPFVDESTREVGAAKKIMWVDKSYVVPENKIDPENVVGYRQTITEHEEDESVAFVDDKGHNAYRVDKVDVIEVTTDISTSQHMITYEKPGDTITDPDLIRELGLKTTDRFVGNNGYINTLQNEAQTISLSCAMSQLGIRVKEKGTETILYENISVYNLSGASTVYDKANNTATTTYNIPSAVNLPAGLKLVQTVSAKDDNLINGDTSKNDGVVDGYKLDYKIINDTGKEFDIEMRLAFDTMNTSTSARVDSSNSYTLSNDIASITVSSSGPNLTRSIMTDISDLYGKWDYTMSGSKTFTHTGAGFWFDVKNVGAGESKISSVDYGNVTYNKVPIKYEDKTVYKDYHQVVTTITKTGGVIMPTYLDIQAGAEAWQIIPIRLWDLSSESLGVLSGTDVSAFHAQESLENIDRAFEKINEIRSYYGATTNRLEAAYRVNKNVEENTQAAESLIRDTDMATEMTANMKNEVLSQAGTQMLAQANQSKQGVLSLIQSQS